MHAVGHSPRGDGTGSVSRILTIVALSTLISFCMFLAAEVFRSGRSWAPVKEQPAAHQRYLSPSDCPPHDSSTVAKGYPFAASASSPCNHSSALRDLCHLGVKRLARMKQEVFCEDSHPLEISGGPWVASITWQLYDGSV